MMHGEITSNWKKVALNRDEWAKLLRKARPTRGCRANDDEVLLHVSMRLHHLQRGLNLVLAKVTKLLKLLKFMWWC
jgi:hypothetical protein